MGCQVSWVVKSSALGPPRSVMVPHDASRRLACRPRLERSQKASQPTTRDSPSLAGLHSLAVAHDVGIRTARRARRAKRSCCEIPEAKANRVARAGEPSGSVKRRGRSASRGDASCGTMTDRGEAASSRLPSPGHLAPCSTALFAALQRCSWPAGITANDLIG